MSNDDKIDPPPDPNSLTDEDLARLSERARSHAAARPPASDPQSAADFFRDIGAKGQRIAEERVAKGLLKPDVVHESPREPETALDRALPAFVRSLTLDSDALRARVERKEAIEETRTAIQSKRQKLVFVGVSGSGKTSLAAAALRAWYPKAAAGPRTLWLPARDVAFARSRYPLGEGDPPLLSEAIGANMIVLDDLGQDPTLASSMVLDVVSGRYDAVRPFWVTTWLPLVEMSQRYGDGFARRVLEGATVIQCGYEPIPMNEDP